MPQLLSCTFCPHISSPTPSCCTTTWHRTDRVVLDSAVSQAGCNRSPKAASPATLTPPTGPTENCSPDSTSPSSCVHKVTETRNTPSQSSPYPPTTHPQVLISLLGPHSAPFLKLVVHVRYLCIYIYIYCICNSRILNVVATFYF